LAELKRLPDGYRGSYTGRRPVGLESKCLNTHLCKNDPTAVTGLNVFALGSAFFDHEGYGDCDFHRGKGFHFFFIVTRYLGILNNYEFSEQFVAL
jgi:hypothetical protein